jgi:hypothetical protein
MSENYISEKLEDVEKQLDRIESKLTSFLVRLDRVEQSQARTRWHIKAWMTAAIGALTVAAVEHFTR